MGTMLQPGQTVDRYSVEAVIGKGGMATVYRVRHSNLGSVHALKVLSVGSPAIQERLLQEGRVQATLRHPNVVAVTDVFEVEGNLALIMEYIDGPTLAEWLAVKRPSIDESLKIFNGIVRGVRHAHNKGLIHRDLKPANVMLAPTDQRLVPKVLDFGLAKTLMGDSSRTDSKAGLFMGTPEYAAPEQIRNAAGVDRRADLFSLGCMLYELVCGKPPFTGPDFMAILHAVTQGKYTPANKIVPDLPEEVNRSISALLMVDPARRPQSCQEVMDMLEGQTPGTGFWERPREGGPLRPPPAGLGSLAAVGSDTWLDLPISSEFAHPGVEDDGHTGRDLGHLAAGDIGTFPPEEDEEPVVLDDVVDGTLALDQPVVLPGDRTPGEGATDGTVSSDGPDAPGHASDRPRGAPGAARAGAALDATGAGGPPPFDFAEDDEIEFDEGAATTGTPPGDETARPTPSLALHAADAPPAREIHQLPDDDEPMFLGSLAPPPSMMPPEAEPPPPPQQAAPPPAVRAIEPAASDYDEADSDYDEADTHRFAQPAADPPEESYEDESDYDESYYDESRAAPEVRDAGSSPYVLPAIVIGFMSLAGLVLGVVWFMPTMTRTVTVVQQAPTTEARPATPDAAAKAAPESAGTDAGPAETAKQAASTEPAPTRASDPGSSSGRTPATGNPSGGSTSQASRPTTAAGGPSEAAPTQPAAAEEPTVVVVNTSLPATTGSMHAAQPAAQPAAAVEATNPFGSGVGWSTSGSDTLTSAPTTVTTTSSASTPTGAPGRVNVVGDAKSVMLIQGTQRLKVPASVPAGTYTVKVWFDDGEGLSAGTITVDPGGTHTLACSSTSLKACTKR